jgi:hypothetical protein
MITKTFAVLCLLGLVAPVDVLPAYDGKYFYVDYKSSTQYGVKYVSLQMGQGEARRKMNVFVTTS